MDVEELSRDQLDELKNDYYWQLYDSDSDVLDDVTCPSDIPDDVIVHHFQGVCFSPDDFFCSMG